MHLHQLMGWSGPMTLRQYDTWQAWLELELDNPSRSDWYLMQVAAMQAGKKVALKELKLKFGKGGASTEQQVEWAKERAKLRVAAGSSGKIKRGD